MRDQVEAFHRQSGQKVAIVAESEGALVAKTYLAATPGAPVDELVMLSPLVQPARVWYPERGASGWGLASGWELRELGGLFRDVSGADMSADMPVVRSLIDHGPAVRDLLACPLPGTRQLALFPLADAVATPHPSEIGIPSEVVPAFHGGLLADDRVRQAVSTYLEDGKVAPATVWPVAQEILRASAAAWQVPELPLTLNQDWNGPPGRSGSPPPSPGSSCCCWPPVTIAGGRSAAPGSPPGTWSRAGRSRRRCGGGSSGGPGPWSGRCCSPPSPCGSCWRGCTR